MKYATRAEGAEVFNRDELKILLGRIKELPSEIQSWIFEDIANQALGELARFEPDRARQMVERVIEDHSSEALKNRQTSPHKRIPGKTRWTVSLIE